MGSNSNSNRKRQKVRMLFFFVIVSLLSSFLHLALLLFRLFLFQQLQQQAGHKRKEPDGRDGIYVGGDSNVGRHGGTEGADGANGCVFFYVFVLSTLRFYSYHSSSFPITSVQQQAARMGQINVSGDGNAGRDAGGQAGTTGTSSSDIEDNC